MEIDNNIGKVQSNSPLNIKHEHENHFNFLNSSLPCNHVNVLVDASSGPLCFLLANLLLCLRLAPIPAGTLKSTRVWVARLPLASVPTHVHTHKNKRLIQLFRYLVIQLFSYLGVGRFNRQMGGLALLSTRQDGYVHIILVLLHGMI